MSGSVRPPPTDGHDDPRVPRTWEKVVCVIPLFLIFVPMTILAQRVMPFAQQAYREMDLAPLPPITELALLLDRMYLFHPVTAATAFVLQLPIQMTWAGRTYRRMFWFDLCVLLGVTFLFWTCTFAMFAPLMVPLPDRQ